MKSAFFAAATAALLATTSLAGAQDINAVLGANLGAQAERADYDFGYFWGWEDVGYVLGDINAKVGVVVAPGFTVQFDAAYKTELGAGVGWDDDYGDYDYTTSEEVAVGIAHLTYRHDQFFVGALGGVLVHGDFAEKDIDVDRIIGLEAGYDADEFSIVGQIGYTAHPDPEDWTTIYAGVDATYYLTPDLSIAANGVISQDDGKDMTYRLGASVRHKLEGTPLILSANYRASLEQDYYDNWTESQHRVTFGFHVPLGSAGTLRDIDRATGLKLVDY